MNICLKCKEPHNKSGKFCSRRCANARQWSVQDKEQKSLTIKKFIENNPSWLLNMKLSMPHRTKHTRETKDIIYKERFLAGLMKDVNVLKKWLRKTGTVDICNVCKLSPEWNGIPLVLQLDHIDGNNKNNLPSNLQLICPNCHSQTETYCGKNIKLIKLRDSK